MGRSSFALVEKPLITSVQEKTMPHSLHHTYPDLPEQVFTSSWQADLVSRLPANYAQQAVAQKAFQRARPIRCPADLLRGILAYVLSTYSLRALSGWAVLIDLAEMSDRAWGKRLRQAGPWLQWLLESLLEAPSVAHLLPSLPEDVRVVLIDASSLKQPGGTGDDWRLHLAYDLLRGQMAEIRLTDQQGGESLAPFHLRAGDVIVSDRGSGYRKNVAAADAQGAQVLLRFTPHTCPLQQDDGTPLEVVAWLKAKSEGTPIQAAILWWEGRRYRVQVLAQSLPAEAAERARQERRESAQRHGQHVQADTLFLAGWLLLISTLDPLIWSPEDALHLYRARWQIELVFKRMKQILRLNHVRSKHPQTIQATLYALWIAWALQEQEGHWLRAHLEALPQVMAPDAAEVSHAIEEPAGSDAADAEFDGPEGAVSSWLLATMVLQTVRQAVLGQWTFARLRAVLPRLRRLLCGSHRRRVHQERQMRARLFALYSPGRDALFTCSCA
jgi:hypothetical protein